MGCEDCYDLAGDIEGPLQMKCEENVDGVSTYVCSRCQRKVSVGISINGVDVEN